MINTLEVNVDGCTCTRVEYVLQEAEVHVSMDAQDVLSCTWGGLRFLSMFLNCTPSSNHLCLIDFVPWFFLLTEFISTFASCQGF